LPQDKVGRRQTSTNLELNEQLLTYFYILAIAGRFKQFRPMSLDRRVRVVFREVLSAKESLMQDDSRWEKVGRVDTLDRDYPTLGKVGDIEVALCIVDGDVFALANICSHAFSRLSDGFVEGIELFCPLHHGSFDIRSGAAVASPCVDPIKVYQVKTDNGDVYIKVP
jgi:nitrite reductase/ring-hydroxylating ferredoxin subunit